VKALDSSPRKFFPSIPRLEPKFFRGLGLEPILASRCNARRKGKKPLEPLFSKPGQVLETSTNLSVKVVWKGTEDTEWIPSDRYKVVTQKIYDEVALCGNTEENNSVEGSNSESTNEHYSESQEGYVSHEISRDSIEESVETVDTSDLKDNYYMPTNSAGSDWFPEEKMRVSIYMPYLKRHCNGEVVRYVRSYDKFLVKYDDGEKREEKFDPQTWTVLSRPVGRRTPQKYSSVQTNEESNNKNNNNSNSNNNNSRSLNLPPIPQVPETITPSVVSIPQVTLVTKTPKNLIPSSAKNQVSQTTTIPPVPKTTSSNTLTKSPMSQTSNKSASNIRRSPRNNSKKRDTDSILRSNDDRSQKKVKKLL
jgi:hypothetical protein